MTKSPEEAAREAKEAPTQQIPHTNSNLTSHRNTTSIESTRRHSIGHMHRSNTPNATIQRNEDDAMRTEKRGEDESDRPDRTISTARSPSAERGGLHGQTLPVVEEMGEASSTGGRSAKSRERDADERPLTPAKDERPLTPAKDYDTNGHGVIRRALSRSSLDKELPALPIKSAGELRKKDSMLS